MSYYRPRGFRLLAILVLGLVLALTGCSLGRHGEPRSRPTPTVRVSTQAVATPTAAQPLPTPTPSEAHSSGGSTDSIRLQGMRLQPTYNSVAVELPFVGDADGNARVQLQFRSGDSPWRDALPPWRVRDEAFYGSILLLAPGTKYEIRASVEDPDGVVGRAVVSQEVTTWPEDNPAPADLRPTYFVRANGSDEADGRSPTSAWRTLEKAFEDAPPGAVVQVGPGSYTPPTVERDKPLTLVAQYPAVDDDRNPINEGKRAIIEPAVIASPRGSGGEHEAPWRRVTLKGPATGQSFSIWAWRGAPVEGVVQMAFAPSLDAPLRRVAKWDIKDGTSEGFTMEAPEGWTEILYTNRSYNYGFAAFGSDVYLRLPGDVDPNTQYVWLKDSAGELNGNTVFDADDVRLSGFEVRLSDVVFDPDADHGMVDHNLFQGASVVYRAAQKPSYRYPTHHTVERNLFEDQGTWSEDPSLPAIPWTFIKGALLLRDGKSGWSRIGAEAETTAVWGRGGANALVVRYNTIRGYFNGVSPGYQKDYDRYAGYNQDVHDNLISQIADDAIEIDGPSINFKAWHNRIEHASVALSTAPLSDGPAYFFRNQVWQLGNDGVGADLTGNKGVGVTGFKYSGTSSGPGLIYVVHNTFWTNRPEANGGAQFGSGGGSQEHFWLRNNLFVATRYAFSAPGNSSTSMAGKVTKGTTSDIKGTRDDEIYQRGRYGDFAYHIPVPNGEYKVVLKFAETFHSEPGQRLFDVYLEGERVLHRFDIARVAGPLTAVDRSFETEVKDKSLDITFKSLVDNALLSGLEAIGEGGRVIRIDAGSESPHKDASGAIWSPDEYYGEHEQTGKWNEDYDYFATTDTTRGLGYGGNRYTKDVGAYRRDSGQGEHTNLSGSFIQLPDIPGAPRGDLSLPDDSPLVDAGVPVPNISDLRGRTYLGSAPDIGALEKR